MKQGPYQSQWIPRDTVARVKRLDLLAYLERYDPHELVRVSRDVYATRTHDSLKISNGKWCWWSQGIGGRSALDYLIKVRGMGFQEAVLHLMGCMEQMPDLSPPLGQPATRKTPLPFRLPPRNQDNRRILAYLTGRGIALPLLQACIRAGMLYEDKRHNCVFVGFDEKSIPRYGFIRSSAPNSTFLRDVNGSDKRYSFCIAAKSPSDTLHLYESAIDLLSYITLEMESREEWQHVSYLSLSGVYAPAKDNPGLPAALEQYLRIHPKVRKITLCLDNDRGGHLAAEAIQERLPASFFVQTHFPISKDYNAQLMANKGLSGILTRTAQQQKTERVR